MPNRAGQLETALDENPQRLQHFWRRSGADYALWTGTMCHGSFSVYAEQTGLLKRPP